MLYKIRYSSHNFQLDEDYEKNQRKTNNFKKNHKPQNDAKNKGIYEL